MRPSSGSTRLQTGQLLVAGVVLLLLLRPMLISSIQNWRTVEALHFGFLVPPLAVLLFLKQYAALRPSLGRGSSAGIPLILAALLVLLAAERLSMLAAAAWAAGLLIWSTVVALWGWRAARGFAFPIGLLAFGLSLDPWLIAPIAFALQRTTANGAALVAHGFGLPIRQDGLVLRGNGFAFVVAEACSGMSSLLALLTLAALWLHVTRGPGGARLTVVGSVLPLVLLANTLRVVLVLVIAAHLGQAAATGFFHAASSFFLFGFEVAGLAGVSWIVRCMPHTAF